MERKPSFIFVTITIFLSAKLRSRNDNSRSLLLISPMRNGLLKCHKARTWSWWLCRDNNSASRRSFISTIRTDIATNLRCVWLNSSAFQPLHTTPTSQRAKWVIAWGSANRYVRQQTTQFSRQTTSRYPSLSICSSNWSVYPRYFRKIRTICDPTKFLSPDHPNGSATSHRITEFKANRVLLRELSRDFGFIGSLFSGYCDYEGVRRYHGDMWNSSDCKMLSCNRGVVKSFPLQCSHVTCEAVSW